MSELKTGLKKALYVGVGMVATTLEKASNISEDLAKTGEKVVSKGKVYNEELQHNVKSKIASFTETKKANDLTDLAQQINELDENEQKLLQEKLAALKQAATDYSIEVQQNSSEDNG